ncbi:hypothetical protein [Halorussus litoreus]|uniref:hypothetical protein n=1 Tax=Halorussus litoreus TaxID=1710536 RepID=UPI000E230D86|nr:hypothetical protein [Halorussus litoreus]
MTNTELPSLAEKVTLLLVGGVVGILAFTTYLLSTGQGVQNLELLNIVINSGLTLALVVLYLKMANVQEKQATLAEIERTPLVEISGYEVEGDDIIVYLSNYGNGTATNLELVTVSHFDADSELLEAGTSPEPLVRATDDVRHNYERSIRPHDERVKFTASPGLVTHRDQERGGFSLSISMLESEGVENVAYQLFVRYSTRTEDRYAIPLFQTPREINVDEDLTFSDAYSINPGVKSVPYFIPDPDYSLPPHLDEDAGHPVRRDELGL